MLNIIWIIVDSVRNYACPADRIDDRGRISLMDELSDTWIDFKNVVTSAPSTVMSISAMFTSTPAYYLGANFNDFKLDDAKRPTIGSILKDHGYNTYFNTLLANEREAWASILDHVPKKVWAKGLSHRIEWNNEKISETVKNLTEYGLKEPFFYYLHYNVRGDENISKNVKNGIHALEDNGYFDNSVVLLTSDHGYPDPFRQDEVKRMGKLASLEHRRLPHDLVLTDDNILVPLLIRYPGHKPNDFYEQISTLDYLPTTLELAGIKDYPKMSGKSLVPLINGDSDPEIENRKLRIDGRFLGQKGRCTAIRSSKYKYIFYHDLPNGQREQFYDLTIDSLETNNILENNANKYSVVIEEFRSTFRNEEIRGYAIQKETMKAKYIDQLKKYFPLAIIRNNIKILCLLPDAPSFIKIFSDIMYEIHGEEHVKIIYFNSEEQTENLEHFDLALGIVLENTGNHLLSKKMQPIISRKKFYVDLNLNFARFLKNYALSLFTIDWRIRKKYYFQEPLYLLERISNSIKRVAKR